VASSGIGKVPLVKIVEESIKNGVTIVQLREKKMETREFMKLAKSVKQITDHYQVPLIINDRIDVALAIDAAGVHLGQSDMPVNIARKLIGNNKIIGATVGNELEALQAFKMGADYLGTNPIYSTPTKTDSPVMGIKLFQKICESTSLPIVGIGGIDIHNVEEVISAGADGIAVVSAICSAPDIADATSKLKNKIINSLPHYSEYLAKFAANTLMKIRSKKPLIQHLTNFVVMNETANITLQVGARPVMAHENEEITALSQALVLNIGTLDATFVTAMNLIGRAASNANIPIVLDPVGAGATTYRTNTSKQLLKDLKITVLRGNSGEIGSLAGQQGLMSGVDAVSRPVNCYELVKNLAKEYKTVVAMTGKHDIISDGNTILEVHNNHQLLPELTGTGCGATAVIAAFISVEKEEPLKAAASALSFYSYAAEIAGSKSQCKGPGTFYYELLDSLYNTTPQEFYSNAKIVEIKENEIKLKKASL
jgi:thiamine-phosphate diphosphorylase/hydroxyethylthiazole kinase